MSATNSSSNATVSAGSTATSDVIPKSVITICILVGAFVVGVLIAKLVNYCYNRADIPDNASDISEHTKGLLRIQLALMKFGKSGAGAEGSLDPEEAKRQQQATVLGMWKMKAMNKAAVQKAEEQAAAAGVHVVDETAKNGRAGKGGAAAAAAASAKNGGKAGAGAKPKAFVRPRKLFPNSVAGVAPSAPSAPSAPPAQSATTADPSLSAPPVAKTTAGGSAKAWHSGPQKPDQSEA